MESSTSIAQIVCGGILLVVLILPAFLLSRLTKVEHDDFYNQWVKDGRPHGMPFWFDFKEPFSLSFRSYPWFVGTWWLFKTPEWVKGHQSATKLLSYYRLISYILYLGLFFVCLLIFLSSPR
jgi:hypothetical protein